jgi:hypothetical protein
MDESPLNSSITTTSGESHNVVEEGTMFAKIQKWRNTKHLQNDVCLEHQEKPILVGSIINVRFGILKLTFNVCIVKNIKFEVCSPKKNLCERENVLYARS